MAAKNIHFAHLLYNASGAQTEQQFFLTQERVCEEKGQQPNTLSRSYTSVNHRRIETQFSHMIGFGLRSQE